MPRLAQINTRQEFLSRKSADAFIKLNSLSVKIDNLQITWSKIVTFFNVAVIFVKIARAFVMNCVFSKLKIVRMK